MSIRCISFLQLFLLLSCGVPESRLAVGLARPAAAAPLEAKADSVPAVVAVAAPDSVDSVIGARLDALLANEIFERTQLGLYVYDLTADRPVYEHHIRQLMRPASNQKIVTAVAALAQLGGGYEYATRIFRKGEVKDSVLHGDLYVRGAFDPLLGKADVRRLAEAVREAGIYRIGGDLVFDRSLKDTLQWGWGWCWDDDMPVLSPLLCDGKPGLDHAVAAALDKHGIDLDGECRYGCVGGRDTALVAVCKHSIAQVLRPMMKVSDNLFAESLFYHVGAQGGKPYAGHEQAAECIGRLVKSIGLRPDHYQMADGSGVSLYNYLTPELIVGLLRYAYRHESIYSLLVASLPVAGKDGTLRKRMRGTPAQGNVKAKTGTVEGVSTLAGYATAPNGHLLCFSIMNQGIRYTSTGRNFQDRVCVALTAP